MPASPLSPPRTRAAADLLAVRQLADQAFSRASGAPLRGGNRVRLLKDAVENYPAWLTAIAGATSTIHLEMYFISDDEQGVRFADALLAKAQAGVSVVVIYDWLGGRGYSRRAYWNRLRAGGVEVLCYNRLRFDEPIGWVSRDHRKSLIVDGTIGFVTGLCIGQQWIGDRVRGLDPWRDTGVQIEGPAVADLEAAFVDSYLAAGGDAARTVAWQTAANGDSSPGTVALRVVATEPNTGFLFRVDQLVAAMARQTLWLTDAYYGGTSPYVQALSAAARDGVDVRLLVPGSSDIPVVRALSRAGYRPLLEAGVRVFEWKGSMLHAKTAVADGRWARVGSTNLNIASWIGNRELDVVIEDEAFAGQVEQMYLQDLNNSTEIVLDAWHHLKRSRRPAVRRSRPRGSGGRLMAGAIRVGHTMAAAMTSTRVLEPVEAHIALLGGALLLCLALVAWFVPRVLTYPMIAIAVWFGLALTYRAWTLYRKRRRSSSPAS